MIYVHAPAFIVVVHGAHTMADIEAAVLEVTQRKRWTDRARWVVVGLADASTPMITTGMAFQPPDDRAPVGFRRGDDRQKK
jgi:hypothetical protein